MDPDKEMAGPSGVQNPRVIGGAGNVPNRRQLRSRVTPRVRRPRHDNQEPVEVLMTLFQHCSNSELLENSLVSKFWHSEARNVLKKRGNVKANLGCGEEDQVRADLVAFGADLRQMKNAILNLNLKN